MLISVTDDNDVTNIVGLLPQIEVFLSETSAKKKQEEREGALIANLSLFLSGRSALLIKVKLTIIIIKRFFPYLP